MTDITNSTQVALIFYIWSIIFPKNCGKCNGPHILECVVLKKGMLPVLNFVS